MTFKYIYAYGEEQLAGYEDIYQFCHVPIDNFVIEALHNRPVGKQLELTTRWSRIEKYQEYLAYQKILANAYVGTPLLDMEFSLWNNEKERRTNIKNIKD